MQHKVAFFWTQNISYLSIYCAKINCILEKLLRKEGDEQENIKNASVNDGGRNHDWSGNLF